MRESSGKKCTFSDKKIKTLHLCTTILACMFCILIVCLLRANPVLIALCILVFIIIASFEKFLEGVLINEYKEYGNVFDLPIWGTFIDKKIIGKYIVMWGMDNSALLLRVTGVHNNCIVYTDVLRVSHRGSDLNAFLLQGHPKQELKHSIVPYHLLQPYVSKDLYSHITVQIDMAVILPFYDVFSNTLFDIENDDFGNMKINYHDGRIGYVLGNEDDAFIKFTAMTRGFGIRENVAVRDAAAEGKPVHIVFCTMDAPYTTEREMDNV